MSAFFWMSLIILILILSAWVAKKYLKLDLYLGVFILVKTRKFLSLLDNLAKPKKLLEIFTDIGIVLGFGAFGLDYLIKNKLGKVKRFFIFVITSIAIAIITYFLSWHMLFNNPIVGKGFGILIIVLTGIMGLSGFTLGSLIYSAADIIFKLFEGKTGCPGVGLVIPGVKMPKVDFFIPWYGWIILLVSGFIHELMHGALLRIAKVKLKSLGLIFAAILPLGAFVEPDEKELEKKSHKNIARMYSAGPTSNVVLAVIFFIILLVIAVPINNYVDRIDAEKDIGIVITQIDQNTQVCGSVFDNSAHGKLQTHDLIVSINGNNIKTIADLESAIKNDYDNEFVLKNIDNNIVRTEYLRPNALGKIGFTGEVISDPSYELTRGYFFLRTLLSVLTWIALLNFIIATVNYLPTFPFDGGAMSQIIFSDYLNKKNNHKKRMKIVAKFFGLFVLLLVLLNIIPYFL